MYQIRFRLKLRLRSRWGSSQRSPRLPNWILGDLLLTEGRGGEGGREMRGQRIGGRVNKRGREKKRGTGKGREER